MSSKNDSISMNENYGHTLIYKFVNRESNDMCLSVFIDQSNEYPVAILQFFLIDGSGLCMHLNHNLVHMFYGWNFSHCTDLTIIFLKDKYFLYSNDDTYIFGSGDLKK